MSEREREWELNKEERGGKETFENKGQREKEGGKLVNKGESEGVK